MIFRTLSKAVDASGAVVSQTVDGVAGIGGQSKDLATKAAGGAAGLGGYGSELISSTAGGIGQRGSQLVTMVNPFAAGGSAPADGETESGAPASYVSKDHPASRTEQEQRSEIATHVIADATQDKNHDGAPAGGEPDAAKRSAWEVCLGPLEVGSNGLELKPQMKIGARAANFKVEAGLCDVRDGLKFQAKAGAAVQAQSEGRSLKELHQAIHCETPGFREALKVVTCLLGAGTESVLCQIAKILKLSPAQLDGILSGEGRSGAAWAPMKLRVIGRVEVGLGAEVRLGWCDTKGFRMVGVGGEVAHAASCGANLFAGRHTVLDIAKVIVGITNFHFEYTFPLSFGVEAPPPPSDAECLAENMGQALSDVERKAVTDVCVPAIEGGGDEMARPIPAPSDDQKEK